MNRKAADARYREANREKIRKDEKARRDKRRVLVLEAYGSVCVCCSESRKEFLTVDHNGAQPIKAARSGNALYRWLVKNNFPSGYQTLCFNCNGAKGIYDVCPHENEKLAGVV